MTIMMTTRDWKRQKAVLDDEAHHFEKKGDTTHSVLYESVSLLLSELETLEAHTGDLHGRLALTEDRIQEMVHQVAGLESRMHEEVE